LRRSLREIARILATARHAGFFCLKTEEREGYRVFDLGRYEITFGTTGYRKTLWVDEGHCVTDGAAFGEVQDAIFALSAVFGRSFDWGPYGIATVPIDSD